MPPPLIDGRDHAALRRDIQELLPWYVPQWQWRDSGPGRALAEAFVLLQRASITRLNRVPDKLFLAFLEHLGLALRPALPARVPVTFLPASGTLDDVLVPSQTQVAAAEQVFETEAAFVASPAALQAVCSVVPQDDLIVDHVPHLRSATPTVLFRAQDRQGNVQEHSLYLGDQDLLNLNAAGSITLLVDADQPALLRSDAVQWEWWGVQEPGPAVPQWQPWRVSGAGNSVVLSKAAGAMREFAVHGRTGRWLRCRVTAPLQRGDGLASLRMRSLIITATRQGLAPDLAFANDIPLQLPASPAKPLTPFGPRPRVGDVWYLASQEALSKQGSRVTIQATNVTAMPSSPSAVLSWEYWDGHGWRGLPLAVEPVNADLHATGPLSLTFVVPDTLRQTRVAGQENAWLRVRIAAGDYGQEIFTAGQLPDTRAITPPRLASLTLSYTAAPQAPAAAVTLNNLQYQDWQQPGTLRPFVPLDDLYQALYLGFDRPLHNGPFAVLIELTEQDEAAETRPQLLWDYTTRDMTLVWDRLDIDDGTAGLTRTGIVRFLGPADAAVQPHFGQQLFWLRAVDSQGRFAGTSAASRVQVPPPLLHSLVPNTTWARQTASIRNERLGASTGTAGQVFRLSRAPIVSAVVWVNEQEALTDDDIAQLKATGTPMQEDMDSLGNRVALWVQWQPVTDLSTAAGEARVYALEPVQGLVQFGDGQHGKVPPMGRDNIKADYDIGGGRAGNVGMGAITALRTTVAGIDRVRNPLVAAGGADSESMTSLITRGPQVLKHRQRATTREDYEWLAREASPAIASVHCLPHYDAQRRPNPGWVTVLIVPYGPEARPFPSLTLRDQVKTYLAARAANVVTAPQQLVVAGPVYLHVSVTVDVYPVSLDVAALVEQNVRTRLSAFLHPTSGGLHGQGWSFGQVPCLSDFLALVQGIDGVEHLANLSVRVEEPRSKTTAVLTMDGLTALTPSPYMLISSGIQHITLREV